MHAIKIIKTEQEHPTYAIRFGNSIRAKERKRQLLCDKVKANRRGLNPDE